MLQVHPSFIFSPCSRSTFDLQEILHRKEDIFPVTQAVGMFSLFYNLLFKCFFLKELTFSLIYKRICIEFKCEATAITM